MLYGSLVWTRGKQLADHQYPIKATEVLSYQAEDGRSSLAIFDTNTPPFFSPLERDDFHDGRHLPHRI